jgi:hypothetical protein
MAAVGLRIIEPENDAAFTGIPTVIFRGAVIDLPATLAAQPLYFRWYSSLHSPPPGHYSMSDALTDAATPSPELMGMGSHVITFAASDRSGETDAEFEAMQHGGVTGGLKGESRCLIHVFKANILAPLGGSVSRTGIVLGAEAPPAWAKSVDNDGEPPYALDEDYHGYNRLRYRWRFEPVELPAGRPILEFIPEASELQYVPATGPDPCQVDYTPSPLLPATATGSYRIVLYVEDAMAEGIGRHQAEVLVTLT